MKNMRKYLFLLLASVALTLTAQTARKVTVNITADGQANIVGYLPEHPTGKAIVDCPGGGYSHLSMTNEGHDWAEYFNKQGIAFFVLTYRMPKGDRTIPVSDAQNAIRTVRDSAQVWNINPRDVGIMGFSAGGHLASTVSTHSEFDCRPDFSILFYPVISMDERVSHKWSCVNFLSAEGQKDPALVHDFSTQNAVRRHLTPPAIIISASDDRLVPFVTNGLEYYKAMRNAGNDCAMLVYPTGDHGFGFGTWFKYHDQLLNDLGAWLQARQTPKPGAIRVACIGNSITDGHGIDMATAYGYPAELQKMLGNDYWVKNFGVSGRTMLNKGDEPYMNEVAWADAQAFKPDVVIIKLGTNDSKPQNWQYKAEFQQDLEQMITTLCPQLAQPAGKKKGKKASPRGGMEGAPKIFLCTPIPALSSNWDINETIIRDEIIPIQQEVAKKYGLKVIDLHTLFTGDAAKMLDDGIHPDGKGAHRIAELIATEIKQ